LVNVALYFRRKYFGRSIADETPAADVVAKCPPAVFVEKSSRPAAPRSKD
jgi:hypothetical protein